MSLVRLKQLAQEAATAGQAIVWDAVNGLWVPGTPKADYASLFSAVVVGTTNAPYVDGFAGGSISPPEDGDYLVDFSAQIQGSSTSNEIAIAIGLNSTTVAVAESIRFDDVGNGFGQGATVALLLGLVQADTIHGIFGRQAGSGTSSLGNRRITMRRVA